jgi:hypothetical protein
VKCDRPEQEILRLLAVEREPVSISDLLAGLMRRAGGGAVVEAIEALRRRSLVERVEVTGSSAVFTLQPVVLEFVTQPLANGY